MVDLPEPDRPVNQSTTGFWPFIAALAPLLTSIDCQWMFAERRKAKWIIPMPTVAFDRRSIRTKPPVSRLIA